MVLAAAALAAAEAVAGAAPQPEVPVAPATAAGYEREVVRAGELERVRTGDLPGAGRAARAGDEQQRLRLSYYIGVDFEEVEPGGAQLFEIRCPTRGEQPLAGGTFAPTGGLVTVSSSRINPSTEFPTRPRAWYEAVVNIMSTPLRWKPFVTCAPAKGIIR